MPPIATDLEASPLSDEYTTNGVQWAVAQKIILVAMDRELYHNIQA